MRLSALCSLARALARSSSLSTRLHEEREEADVDAVQALEEQDDALAVRVLGGVARRGLRGTRGAGAGAGVLLRMLASRLLVLERVGVGRGGGCTRRR